VKTNRDNHNDRMQENNVMTELANDMKDKNSKTKEVLHGNNERHEKAPGYTSKKDESGTKVFFASSNPVTLFQSSSSIPLK